MAVLGHRIVHVVLATFLVLTLLPGTTVYAQPRVPRSIESPTIPPPPSTPLSSPSPPPNPLDINLLDLYAGKENLLQSKDIGMSSRPHTPVNTDFNNNIQTAPSPSLPPNSNGLNAVDSLSVKQPVQPQDDRALSQTPTSGYTEPVIDSQIIPNPQPILNPYEAVSVEILPDKQTVLQSKDGKVKVTFPAGAVPEKVRVEYREQRPWESTGTRMVRLFELKGFAIDRQNATVNTFSKQLQIAINHTADELRGLDTRSLRLYYLDEKQKRWLPVSSQYNTTTRTLTSSTDHFTYYGEQANPNISGPGTVMNFQVGLQSGTAVARYPIELPPGPGGFQPRLELVYNSGSVDEMKNKRSVGSWVGIGWTLHPGRISYDEEYKSYSLELNGESYELVSADGSAYYTRPDMFFKITRTGQKWDVRDRSGVYYRFGGTADSQQYYDYNKYYRWD